MSLKYLIRTIIPLLILSTTVACVNDSDDDVRNLKNVVLVYMAADNNLSSYVSSNLLSMQHSLQQSDISGKKLVCFIDKPYEKPIMLSISADRMDTLKVFSELDSSNPSTLSMAIEYLFDNFRSNSYGLVLWSHGYGWLPASYLHDIAPNMGFAPVRDGLMSDSCSFESGSLQPFMEETRSCLLDHRSLMELQDMVSAIPDHSFDFIMFDACYMGCVEVVYELRNKCRYVISSSCEILAEGFPYSNMTSDLVEGNLVKACREYFNYYDNRTDSSRRMGTISLVHTQELDSLARCFRKIVDGRELSYGKSDVSNIQHLDRFKGFWGVPTNEVYFDLMETSAFLDGQSGNIDEFKAQLERCVLYAASTPYMFFGSSDVIEMRSFSGLSVFIPLTDYRTLGLVNEYAKTAWSIATDYK